METKDFQFYSNPNPTQNEMILVQFIAIKDGFFDAILLEYPGYIGIMNFKNATKKRRISSWNKIIPLNKMMVACAEIIDIKMKIVELSIAFFEERYNKDIEPMELQKQLLKNFNDNRTLESFIKSVCHVNKFDFTEIWTKLIHYIDTLRQEYNEENEDEDDTNISIWKYFCDNINDLDDWIEEVELDQTIGNAIKQSYEKKTDHAPKKITTKFGIISPKGIMHTKKFIEMILDKIKYNFELLYESTPNYIFESYDNDSSEDDHKKFCKLLEVESLKYEPKIFIKIIS
jgi:translation initiation factor 2 alpha subunit (eIF-2alpha)